MDKNAEAWVIIGTMAALAVLVGFFIWTMIAAVAFGDFRLPERRKGPATPKDDRPEV